jgi:proteasome lid subunit RPN8/RPN11
MSTRGDDMAFDEVRLREPERRTRPDRDRRLAVVPVGTLGDDDLPVFVALAAADAMERHALSDVSVELGGVLLGKECVDPDTGRPFVWVAEALPAAGYQNTQASFTYTHEAWEHITRERERRFPDLDVVGWYHTHPDFGVFLSGHDRFIHENFFDQPLQVAYVIDPIRQTRGFFHRRHGAIVGEHGFYLVGDRSQRVALARFVNALESLPDAVSGQGLSPRLEAELMSLLTRPHLAAAPAAAGSPALFTLAGTLLGGLAVAVLAWLYLLDRQLGEQSAALRALTEQVARADGPGDAERARVAAKEAALDALLSEVRLGGSAESIRTAYTGTLEQLADAKARLGRADLEKAGLARVADDARAQTRALAAQVTALESDLSTARSTADAAEAARKKAGEELASAQGLLSESGAAGLRQRFQWALWAAAAGWGGLVLALLGLLAVVLRRPAAPPTADPTTPPHRIA